MAHCRKNGATDSGEPDGPDSFDKMGLDESILRGVVAYGGLKKPVSVQRRTIVQLLKGRDCIMQAQSGTGKTLAFVIPVLQRIDTSVKKTQVIIMAPTRELALQIQKVVLKIGRYIQVSCHACIGGRSRIREIERFKKGVHVVVGTPGRVLDMMEKGNLKTEDVKIVCIDEVDHMYREKFGIEDVLKKVPRKDKQVIVLSATIPEGNEKLRIKKAMRSPLEILVKTNELTLEGVQQFFIDMQESWKLDTLIDLYANETFSKPTVVFVNTREQVNKLRSELVIRQVNAVFSHGRMSQKDRESTVKKFKNGDSRILVTSDLLSRGIDVQEIAVVINYDLPKQKEGYMHRIGRSGRLGGKGIAINFVTKAEIRMLRDIEEYYSTQVEELTTDIPTLVRRLSLRPE